MRLIWSFSKNIKINIFYIFVNVSINDNFIYILNSINHQHTFCCCINNSGIWFIFFYNFIFLYSHYQIIAQFFCPFKQKNVSNMKHVINPKSNYSFHRKKDLFKTGRTNPFLARAYARGLLPTL